MFKSIGGYKRSSHNDLLKAQSSMDLLENPFVISDNSNRSSVFYFISHPRKIHKRYQSVKREANLCLDKFSALLTLTFLLIFFLGAENAFHEPINSFRSPSRWPLSFDSKTWKPPMQITPLHSQLHDRFSVPWRFIHLLSDVQKIRLHNMLSTPLSEAEASFGHEHHILFAHVTECYFPECLRAMATAISYARVTGRIALLFVDTIDGWTVGHFFHINNDGYFADDAMVISVQPGTVNLRPITNTSLLDWAELPLVEAAVPPEAMAKRFLAEKALYTELHKVEHFVTNRIDGQPTIGNTKTLATLDNLAVANGHVLLTLSDVMWSYYNPRVVQEKLLNSIFLPKSSTAEEMLTSSSLMGQREATRKIKHTDALLHDEFDIPYMLTRGMSPFSRKLLLLKLLTKQRRGTKRPTTMFVHAQYGLGNRLRALGSAMAFTRRTDRILVLIWVPDQHLNCRFTDLFVESDEFVVTHSFKAGEKWPFRENKEIDVAMNNVKWYNYMRPDGVEISPSSELVRDDKDFHLYVSTCYVIQSQVTPFIMRTTSTYWLVLKSLTPHVHVQRLVDRFAIYPMSQMIGIHIRGKSIKTDISGITERQYTAESAMTTDYWRNLTQVDTFVEEMKRQTADQLFYVAADQKDVFAQLEKEFPTRIFYIPRQCDSRDRDCLPFALADILLLAKCSSLRGSYWSSFTELSTRIGRARFLLAGVDFGRPSE